MARNLFAFLAIYEELYSINQTKSSSTMGIRISSKKTRMPEGMKLAGKIASYLFEQQYGELRHVSASDIEVLRSTVKILTQC